MATDATDNPFEDPAIATQWIHAVENELGSFRDLHIYPRLRQWRAERQPRNVLEVGCGQGHCSVIFANVDCEYLGIEPSTALRHRAESLFADDHRRFVGGLAERLPVEDQTFEAAFSVNVWMHLPDPDPAVRELARVLKAGSPLLIITANPDSYPSWLRYYRNPVRRGKQLEGEFELPVGHLSNHRMYLHDWDDLIQPLDAHGFTVLRSIGFAPDTEREDQPLFAAVEAQRRL